MRGISTKPYIDACHAELCNGACNFTMYRSRGATGYTDSQILSDKRAWQRADQSNHLEKVRYAVEL